MPEKKTNGKNSGGGVTIQLHLAGLAIFSAALVVAAALVTYGLLKSRDSNGGGGNVSEPHAGTNLDGTVDVEATNVPPWGQLTLRDIDLEQPEEYVAYEITTNRTETWTFERMMPDQVRSLMQSCGLAAGEIDRALSPPLASVVNSNTVIVPDDDLVFSLPPETRAKLYTALGHYDSNEFMRYPFYFPTDKFDAWFSDGKISEASLALLKKTVYPRGGDECFSDLEMILRLVPDEAERLRLVKALSHQSAVLMGVRIWPDTDIDKLLGYWTAPAGVRLLDIRPLLESLKRQPNGGGAGILYFLPPFARERLYTYPLPSQSGDPAMDCHWSTMNFFNETPDDRFSDPKYTVSFLLANYYKIAAPSAYGDRIFLLDQKGDAIHSAVYLADDIVFTKNGDNVAQPWMLMHLKDLVAEYTSDAPPQIAVYRNKDN
jgi:hypothetical protein